MISVHCHNDLGLAVANSLAAVEAGAGQVECTINGIGERAGNCSLEEIVMALRTRHDYYQADTGIVTQRLVPTSRLVANITGIHVQRNKAIVGRNAFAHEAGIHQDGMLKERTTYEIMRPEDVGFAKTDLVLGKHSGRRGPGRSRQDARLHALAGEQLDSVFEQFKVLADKKKDIYDGDLAALIEQQILAVGGTVVVRVLPRHHRQRPRRPRSNCVLARGGERAPPRCPAATARSTRSSWPSKRSPALDGRLQGFPASTASPSARTPRAKCRVEVEHEGRTYRGRGVSTDSVEASAKAFLNAVNRIAAVTNGHRQPAASP